MDGRTNQHFDLKTTPLATKDLTDGIAVYLGREASARPPYRRRESDRVKKFIYNEIVARDKPNLDILPSAVSTSLRLWLKDETLEDTEDIPAPWAYH